MTTSRFGSLLPFLALALVLTVACGPGGGSASDAGPDAPDVAPPDVAPDTPDVEATPDVAEPPDTSDVSEAGEAAPDGMEETDPPPDVVESIDDATEVSDAEPSESTAECTTDTDCDDQNTCTADVCAAGGLCVHLALGGVCDDGDPCTTDDACDVGLCAGTPLPGCGEPVCGDGLCQAPEACADCPVDCSPLGEGACGEGCDPTSTPPDCAGNAVCAPVTAGGDLFDDPFFHGNGACGVACASDADCPEGACLTVGGLQAEGVCVPACAPSQVGACGDLAACFPRAADPAAGVCLAATPCGETPDCPCLEVSALTVGSVCLQPCWAGDPVACWSGVQDCLPRAGAEWHTGLCVGFGAACDAVAQSGCAGAETCAPFALAGLGGTAWRCRPAGSGPEGEPCLDQAGCAPGLECMLGACRAFCDPTVPACGTGSCLDVGELYLLAPGVLGACLPACGDTACDPGEDCAGCPDDCGTCAPWCGDTACDPDEDCTTCELDCGACPFCGDGSCDSPSTGLGAGEDCFTCEADCGDCEGTCGDDLCSPFESCLDCPADCGECQESCGDEVCTFGETCWECPADCEACPWTCGDGACDDDETCLSCPADCDLFGFACLATCNPQDGAEACDGNAACVPTLDDRLFPAPFEVGNGACGEGCSADADCGGGVCLSLLGLDTTGLCAPSCTPGGATCADGRTCVPLPGEPERGACAPGPACGDGLAGCPPEAAACVPWESVAAYGLCLPGCWWQDELACDGLGACHPRTTAPWSQGLCVGQPEACDPVAQIGCSEDQTCVVLGGAAISGQARICSARVGEQIEGDPCDPWSVFCAPGLVCIEGACAPFCDPTDLDACAPLACDDIGALFHLPLGALGVCR
jgi:hypothetical protein